MYLSAFSSYFFFFSGGLDIGSLIGQFAGGGGGGGGGGGRGGGFSGGGLCYFSFVTVSGFTYVVKTMG